ncbi:signal peptidase I [Arthrobacter sp. HLT1-20]
MTKNALRLAAWERWLLNAGAALGLLCLVLAGLALLLGLKPLIVVSGSMSPGIPVGSLALTVPTPAAEVASGQVVSVVSSHGTRITHRVVSVDPAAGLTLKGDANPVADLQPYSFGPVDRVVFSAPFLGYVASWLSSPLVFGLGGLLCVYLLYVAFFRSDAGRSGSARGVGAGRPGMRRRKWFGAGAIIAALAVVISLGVVDRVEATQAAWTASAVASASVAALTLQPVSGGLSCKTTGGLLGAGTSAEISWPTQLLPPGARYAMRVTTGVSTFGYVDMPSGTSMASFGPGLSLLGLVLEGGKQTLPAKLFVVYTTDGKAVDPEGTNIGWSTPEVTSPARTIVYHPGILLLRYFSCT